MTNKTVTEVANVLSASKAEAIRKSAAMAARYAHSIRVETQDDYSYAADELKGVKKKYKELEENRKSITRNMDAAKKKVMDLFREPLGYLSKAEEILKDKMGNYNAKQERIREAELARAQEEQRKEQERLRAEAEKAMEKGDVEVAAALEFEADATPVVTTLPPEKTEGISYREDWYAEVTDEADLITAVLKGNAPSNLIIINMAVLNAMARTLKKGFNVPGVVAKTKKVMAAKSG